ADGNHLFTARDSRTNVNVFDIAASGSLTNHAGSPYNRGSTGSSPSVALYTLANPAVTLVSVSGGNVTVADTAPGGKADTLTLSRSAGGNLRVHDPNNPVTAGAGAIQIDPNTVEVAAGSITGTVQ